MIRLPKLITIALEYWRKYILFYQTSVGKQVNFNHIQFTIASGLEFFWSETISFSFFSNELFQKESSSRPKWDGPLGGAGDAFEAEHIHELECIENILLSISSHTQKRGDNWATLGGGIWKKMRGIKALKRMETWSHDCSDFSYTSTFSSFHPPPIIRIIPLQWPLLTPPLAPGPSPVISGQGSLPAPTNDPISIFGGHKRSGLL